MILHYYAIAVTTDRGIELNRGFWQVKNQEQTIPIYSLQATALLHSVNALILTVIPSQVVMATLRTPSRWFANRS